MNDAAFNLDSEPIRKLAAHSLRLLLLRCREITSEPSDILSLNKKNISEPGCCSCTWRHQTAATGPAAARSFCTSCEVTARIVPAQSRRSMTQSVLDVDAQHRRATPTSEFMVPSDFRRPATRLRELISSLETSGTAQMQRDWTNIKWRENAAY